MTLYARGTAARAVERATAGVLPPRELVCGYYLVRKGAQRRVVRWMPQKGQWVIGGGNAWPAAWWDEIGAKVA